MNPVPRVAERIMSSSLAPWERAAVLGDLQEEACAIAAHSGEQAAREWYWRQTARSVWPNLWRRVRANLKAPDDLRLAASLAAWCLWGVATSQPWTLTWVRDAVFPAFLLAPALYRRWLEPERHMATRSWWAATVVCAMALALVSVHAIPKRLAFVVLCGWMFWPSRRFQPAAVALPDSDDVREPHA